MDRCRWPLRVAWQVLTLRQTKYISLLLRSGFFPFATIGESRFITFHYLITINKKTATDDRCRFLPIGAPIGVPGLGRCPRLATARAFRAGYERRFPRTLAGETVHNPRQRGRPRAGGGL